MRALCLVALLAGTTLGCDDDTTTHAGDLGAGGDDLSLSGADFAGGDLLCSNRSFNGFTGVQTSLAVFACPCGCTVDAMESSVVNPMWGATKTANSNFAPIAGVGLGEDLHYNGSVEQLGLYSVGPTAQFFLDGDFDLLVDYDLVSSPPGQTHVLIGVRDPGVVQSIQTFDIEREQLSDGSNFYATMLGGVPSNMVATSATSGTLRLTRQGFTYKSYGDGASVSTLIAQKAPRVAVTVTATLNDCATNDGGGATCGYQPRLHNLRLASGTLVNLPN
ncbi:MAG: hypothetical protein ACXVAN_11695 [Polyangia bacterium]